MWMKQGQQGDIQAKVLQPTLKSCDTGSWFLQAQSEKGLVTASG